VVGQVEVAVVGVGGRADEEVTRDEHSQPAHDEQKEEEGGE